MPVQCFKCWNSDPKFWDSLWKPLDNLQCFAIWTFYSLKVLIHRSALSLTMLPKMGLFCACVFLVTQSCPALCDSMDYSPSGSSVHGIFQARILEWIAFSFSRGCSQPRDWIRVSCISCISRRILYYWATWEAWPPLWAFLTSLARSFHPIRSSHATVYPFFIAIVKVTISL